MGIDLLSGSNKLHESIADACQWADEFCFCTSALGISGSRSPLWQLLRTKLDKLTQAYVALEALRTRPDALVELHGLGKLRLVPAVDGSFRVNLWQFTKGEEQLAIVSSGALLPPGLVAPHELFLRWKGLDTERFALQVEGILNGLRGTAHVPTTEELIQYHDAFAEAEELHLQLLELGRDFQRPTAVDAELPELLCLTKPAEIDRAQKMLEEAFEQQATFQVPHRLGFQGGSIDVTLNWVAPVMVWGAFRTSLACYENSFGTARPEEGGSAEITVGINIPRHGVNRRLAGAVGRDPRTGAIYLVHGGRIGGGRKGVGAEQFWKNFRSSAWLKDRPEEEPRRVAVVGRLDYPHFLRDAASFVHEVARIKRTVK